MTPLGYVDGKPVFAGDMLVEEHPAEGDETVVIGPKMRQGHFSHMRWRWPEPEKVFPESTLSIDEFSNMLRNEGASLKGSVTANGGELVVNTFGRAIA